MLAVTACLVGCAAWTPRMRAQATVARAGKPACFHRSDFSDSWTVLNTHQVILYAPLYSDAYLVQLGDTTIPDLRRYQHLELLGGQRSGMICNDELDYLLVPQWGALPILEVRQLSMPEEQRLLAEKHIKLPLGMRPTKGNQGMSEVASNRSVASDR